LDHSVLPELRMSMAEPPKPEKGQPKGPKKFHRQRDLTDEELAEWNERHAKWLREPWGGPDKVQKERKFPRGNR
jgi:hypothetical protein